MNMKSMVAVTTDHHVKMFLGEFVALATMATFLLAPAAARAAGPAGESPVVKLESVPGSTIPRVILSAKAAERLGIATGKVGEESVVRKQMVSGLIIPPMDKQPESKPGGGGFGGFGQAGAAPAPATPTNPGSMSENLTKVAAVAAATPTALQKPGGVFAGFGMAAPAPSPQPTAPQVTLPASGEVWVLVTLSSAESERLAADKPARLLSLATRDKLGTNLLAQPSGMQPVEDMKRSMLSLYYVVPGKDHGLAVNNRVRVELQLSGNDEKQKTVPYSSVYYDAKGNAWVYVNGTPLTYERQRITVERVVGDLALLSEGPAVGTPVVTVGAALLYGAEIFKK